MDPSKQDPYLLSRINNIQADLDSKTTAIAEIQRDVGRLCTALLGPNGSVARSQTYSEVSSHPARQASPYIPTNNNQTAQEIDNPSSIGTSLTKVSVTGAPPVPSIKSEFNPQQSIGAYAGNASNNEDTSKALVLHRGYHNPTPTYQPVTHGPPVNTVQWQPQGLPINGMNPPAPTIVGPIVGPQFTTNININGVPRSIPSSLKGSAPAKKSVLAPVRESLGPSAPVFYGRTVRASAPAKVPNWKGGPAPPHVSARMAPPVLQGPQGPAGPIGPMHAIGLMHPIGPVHPNGLTYPANLIHPAGLIHPGGTGHITQPPQLQPNQQHQQQQNYRKFRKGCANCGDITHIQKYCRKKAGEGDGKIFHHRPNHPMNHPVTRSSEKAPGYPIDRQFELIETILAHNRMMQMGIKPPAIPAYFY
ncbi:hypothetical protein TWF696_002448 [Orbilia brochopaga]|uniref:CCHC-type domain-containing protein n=1 Tax=Orbilia brochopaga TaxID=3140254 RepID=A0AAV9U4I9_9PEZI